MNDLISRQAAIKAICEDGTMLERQGKYTMTMAERKQKDADILDTLPPAQPEIIRCKDCEHWTNDDCPFAWGKVGDAFCSYAERRTDDGLQETK